MSYWEYVSQKLSSNPYVIGFDPLNEPLPGAKNIKEFITNILPGQFDKNQLTPLYERIYKKYKAADPESIMYFEPGQFPDILVSIPGIDVNIINPLGFPSPPGGDFGSPYHVLNDHTYCCQVAPSMCSENGEPKPEAAAQCKKYHEERIG